MQCNGGIALRCASKSAAFCLRNGHKYLLSAAVSADPRIQLSDKAREQRIRQRLEQLGQFDWQVFIPKADRAWPLYLHRFEKIEYLVLARGENRLTFQGDHERTLVPMQTYLSMERLK